MSDDTLTKVYLVRHGETEYNRQRLMQGRRINASLNATGRMQAAALGDRFASIDLDAIYASSLRRAIETATAVVKRQRVCRTVRCMTGFDEMCWGVYEGMGSSPELEQMLVEIFGEWERNNFGFSVREGESILDVQARAVEAFREVVERHRGGTILVVSHGRLLRVLLSSLLDEFGLSRMDDVGHHNTCVNEVVVDGSTCRAERLNCVLHLESYHTAA